MRKDNEIIPIFRMVDTLHTGKYIAYLYSSYTGTNQSRLSDKRKIVVLGAGPIRIGQGVEFDYSTVHAARTIKDAGYEAIIINNNPETVSSDYLTADKLYFEPLTPEDVMAIIDFEQPQGIIASLGGQTAINLAAPLIERGCKIIGTSYESIDKAEDRDKFEQVCCSLNIPQPAGKAVYNISEGIKTANEIGYPVLVRPSFVLGGRAMQIVNDDRALEHYLKTAAEIDSDKPVLVDKYIKGTEAEVDGICDGKDVYIPGIMQQIDKTGIHSGDSTTVFPCFSLNKKAKNEILEYSKLLALNAGIIGPFNIQYAINSNDKVFVLDFNPRASRTVPFISKATGIPLADIATKVILGERLKDQNLTNIKSNNTNEYFVKAPVFSFNNLHGANTELGPEMKSTGETIGHDKNLQKAIQKATLAAKPGFYAGL